MKWNFDAVSILFVKQNVSYTKKEENNIQIAELKNGIHIEELHQEKVADHSQHMEERRFTDVCN